MMNTLSSLLLPRIVRAVRRFRMTEVLIKLIASKWDSHLTKCYTIDRTKELKKTG